MKLHNDIYLNLSCPSGGRTENVSHISMPFAHEEIVGKHKEFSQAN